MSIGIAKHIDVSSLAGLCKIAARCKDCLLYTSLDDALGNAQHTEPVRTPAGKLVGQRAAAGLIQRHRLTALPDLRADGQNRFQRAFRNQPPRGRACECLIDYDAQPLAHKVIGDFVDLADRSQVGRALGLDRFVERVGQAGLCLLYTSRCV